MSYAQARQDRKSPLQWCMQAFHIPVGSETCPYGPVCEPGSRTSDRQNEHHVALVVKTLSFYYALSIWALNSCQHSMRYI